MVQNKGMAKRKIILEGIAASSGRVYLGFNF
jgi:hypothetical protein